MSCARSLQQGTRCEKCVSLDAKVRERHLYRCRPSPLFDAINDDAKTAACEALDNIEDFVVFTSDEVDRLRTAGVDLVEEQHTRRMLLALDHCREVGADFASLQRYWADHPWGQGARWTRW